MIRNYNLKKDSKKVFGGIIRIDTSVKGLEKLSNPQGDWVFTPWTFEHVGIENGEEIYEISMPNEQAVNSPGKDALGGKIGVAAAVSNKPSTKLKIRVNNSGEIKFYDPKQEGFYLNEVSEKVVRESMEREKNWALQRAYIFE